MNPQLACIEPDIFQYFPFFPELAVIQKAQLIGLGRDNDPVKYTAVT